MQEKYAVATDGKMCYDIRAVRTDAVVVYRRGRAESAVLRSELRLAAILVPGRSPKIS